MVVDFDFPVGTILPDTLIWGIAYNTATGGYSPIGTPGPYDSLNVGAFTVNPTVGTDVNEDMAFVSDPSTGGFVSQPGWTGNRPMARIEAQVPPPPPSSTTIPSAPTTAAPPTAVSPSGTLPATGGTTGPLTLAVLAGATGVGLVLLTRLRRE